MFVYILIYSILANKLKIFKEYIDNNLAKEWIKESMF